MAGPVNAGAWRLIMREAEELERIASRTTGERARVARLAVMVVEGLAAKVLGGRITGEDIERLRELESLLELYGLPAAPVRRARSVALESAEIRPEPVMAADPLGGIIALV